MPTNAYMYLIAGLIPLIIGSIYYNPKVVGGAWMKVNGFTMESMEGANMLVIFGVTYLFSVMLSFAMTGLVIHQHGAFSMMMPEIMESGSATQTQFNELMTLYGTTGRTFGHGALHGFLVAIFIVLPLLGINALFERRGWKYIFIHLGYWTICLILIGGLICSTLKYAPLS